MYQDYLNEKERYRRRQLTKRQKQRQSLPQRKVRKSTTGVNSYIQQSRNFRRQTEKQFNGLLLTAKIIAGTLKGITRVMQSQIGMIMLGAAALMSVMNYVKTKGDTYSEQYVPEGTGATIMSSGKTSKQGVKDILQYEGFDPVAVDREGDGILTIGHGHKGKDVKPGQKITKEEAFKLFQSDLKPREDAVKKYVKVPITQNMFDALVSFVYNCGVGNFIKSDTLKLLNQGKYKEAAERMKTEYINKGTKHEKGLRNRRAKESAKILSDIDDSGKLKKETINAPIVKSTSAGKIRQLYNGASVGGYKMYNPNTKRNYIELSERAESYLRNTGGQGIITSGAEGSHAKGTISHESGNKIDVQGLKGANTTDNEYAELCINFLKNPETAYINLESFSKQSVENIFEYIKNKDMEAYNLANSKTPYSPGKCWYNQGKLLCALNNPGHPRHLDIGIKPDAYSKNEYNQSKKNNVKEIPVKKEEKTTILNKGTVTGGAANIAVDNITPQEPIDYVNTGAVNMRKAKNSAQNTINKTKKS